jgi:glycosyltransferase involved in cell wall biosynthesis
MNNSLLIVYSNLGLGGVPTKIVDIVNRMHKTHPHVRIRIILKKNYDFNISTTINNPNVTIRVFCPLFPFFAMAQYLIWLWLNILFYKPTTILTFISPYSLPVLIYKIIFFWKKTKIVVSEDHYSSTIIKDMKYPFLQRIGIKYLYPFADVVIVPTLAIKEHLIESFSIPKQNISVVLNWSRYASLPLISSRRENDIIYMGRIDKTKHIILMLEIITRIIKNHHVNIHCLLIGDGPERQECIRYIHSHKLDTNISLLAPTHNIHQYLSKSKIFLFMAEKKAEGFPMAMLDAMSCGTLVLSKYFSGIEEAIQNDNNGFVTHTDNEMVERLLNILRSYRKFQPVITSAKQYVLSKHSLINIDEYTKWFKK